MTIPRRRILRFSLRTLFALVTVVALALGWLMWQRQIVRERQTMRDWLWSEGAYVVVDAASPRHYVQFTSAFNHRPTVLAPKLTRIRTQSQPRTLLPPVRRWFGDEYVDGICLTEDLTARHDEIEKMFPESIVVLESGAMSDDPDRDLLLRQKLMQPTRLAFVNVALPDALDYLRDLLGLECQLDQRALQKAGIDENAPVGLPATELPLDEALAKLLTPLKLTFIVRHEVVVITTEDGVQEYKKTFPGMLRVERSP